MLACWSLRGKDFVPTFDENPQQQNLSRKAKLKCCWPISGEFSDTGNMSPIIVENMVMANIIVTPEKETSIDGEYVAEAGLWKW